MHTITFDSDTEKRLADLAQHEGKRPDELIRELVQDYLEEQEDATAAEAAYQRYLAGEEKTLTLDEVEKRLDLAG
jgi:predicted DNA-binding protein